MPIKLKAQSDIIAQLKCHTRMASMKLVIGYGNAKPKEMVFKEIMKTIITPNDPIE